MSSSPKWCLAERGELVGMVMNSDSKSPDWEKIAGELNKKFNRHRTARACKERDEIEGSASRIPPHYCSCSVCETAKQKDDYFASLTSF